MSDITVAKLSKTLRISPERLIAQLSDSGAGNKTANDTVSAAEKNQLIKYLHQKRQQKKLGAASSQPATETVVTEPVTTEPVATESVTTESVVTSKEAVVEAGKTSQTKSTANDDTSSDEEKKFQQQKEKRLAMAQQQLAQENELKRKRQEALEKQKTLKEKTTTKQENTKSVQQYTVDKATGLTANAGNRHNKKLKKKDKTRLAQELLKDQQKTHGFVKPTNPVIHEIAVGENVKVADLAQKMSIKTSEIIKTMMNMGVIATLNDIIDQETAMLVIEEMGHTAVISDTSNVEDVLLSQQDGSKEKQEQRPPVVTIMGHVDHGKTSILDAIRKSQVAEAESGGITQHIGAYQVTHNKKSITFIDTPGHAAFSKMRGRGANTTDIVILVVAADDGVMPQTLESIQHAKAAKVPMIVAVNKMDKEGADIEKIKQVLSNHDVIAEDWGGDVIIVGVSAKTGQGLDTLLENILLQAEILELTAPVNTKAQGVVLEARLDKGRGKIASVLVQKGTLKVGDIVLAGLEYGRVRMMLDANNQQIKKATPAMPVEILGLTGVPESGDEVLVLDNEKKAKEVSEFRQQRSRQAKLQKQKTAKMANIFAQIDEQQSDQLNLLIKADVKGSSQALCDALTALANEEVSVNIISDGVGAITESDITLANASNAMVLGFNVRADSVAKKLAEKEGIEIRYYSIIYQLIDDVKATMSGLLSPELSEKMIGLAEVRDIFKSPKMGDIAGCMVTEGTVKRNNPIRVLRDNVVIYEGELESLKRFKEDVSDVRAGTECGIGVKNYNNVQVGDQIEVFERIETARTL